MINLNKLIWGGIFLLGFGLIIQISIGPLGNTDSVAYGQEAVSIKAAPTSITYQGYMEESGSPVNRTYAMSFALYNNQFGGTLLDSRSFSSVSVTDGMFSVELQFSSSAWSSSSLYLEITIDGEVMSPRQKVTSVPYALQAGSVHWDDVTDKPNLDGGGDNNHDHSGQIWKSNESVAVLELGNTNSNSGSVLFISDSGDDGIRVSGVNESALWVETAGENGIQVNDVGHSGVFVSRADHYGVWVQDDDGGMRATARFDGDVIITGNICKQVNSAGIGTDCASPHRSVDGSVAIEQSTTHNGNVILDDSGNGIVKLPVEFTQAHNDFAYQLTPIGAPAQVYISQEIKANEFVISGGNAGQKVSWQVTGLEDLD